MMKVLITGGSGFIGKNLSEVLQLNGLDVRVYDLDASTVPGVESVQGDILDKKRLMEAVQGCNAIVHLAAQVSVARSFEYPDETFSINVSGTQNVLSCAEKTNIKRIIVASSAAVYGDATAIPLEEKTTGNLLSPYASSKAENELQIIQARLKGVEAVALRFFNVYGVHQRIGSTYAAVVPSMVHSIVDGKSPTVFGDGLQTRDFVHANDVALCVLKLLEVSWDKVKSPVYNVASQSQISILELINIINKQCIEMKISLQPVNPVFREGRQGDIKHSTASIARIVRDIGWKPAIPFQQGIRELIEKRRLLD